MPRLHPTKGIHTCGNSCEAKFQRVLYDENGEPTDETDWTELARVYNGHQSLCSTQNPHRQDPEAFYGDPQDCYAEPGYCEY